MPLSEVPAFIEAVDRDLLDWMPGCRPIPFGHLGDGNLHYNISQPVGMDKQAFMDRREEAHAIVYKHVKAANGSISAEHGVGRLKKHLLPEVKDPVALELMRMLKRNFDPNSILNPGRVIDL